MAQDGKVQIESLHATPLMGNVTAGQFFIYRGELCVRTSNAGDGAWKAFGFVQKKDFHIPHTDRVELVECDIKYRYTMSQD